MGAGRPEYSKFPNFDLGHYLKENGVYYLKHDSDDHVEYAMNCPMCRLRGEKRSDTKRRLWVNPRVGMFTCYNCDWSGPLERLVQIFSKCDVERAIRILEGRKPGSLEMLNFPLHHPEYDNDDEAETLREVEFPHGFRLFSDSEDTDTIFHRYLEGRDIPLEYAIENGWGFSEVGYTQHRIIVPTYMEERLVFWQARDVLGNLHDHYGTNLYKKVLNPKGVSARSVLYNYDTAKNHGEIILCEGFVDVCKAGANAVATNGKKLHSAQVEWLTKTKARNIVILWDEDAYSDEKRYVKGRNKGKIKKPCSVDAAISMLKSFFDVRCIKLPDGRDAGSYAMGELEELLTDGFD